MKDNILIKIKLIYHNGNSLLHVAHRQNRIKEPEKLHRQHSRQARLRQMEARLSS